MNLVKYIYKILFYAWSPALASEANRTDIIMFYVYILKSKNHKKSYVGFTSNINKRLSEHNEGKNTFTRRYKPWIIIYLEKYMDKTKAIEREKYLKSRSGRREMKKIFLQYCLVV